MKLTYLKHILETKGLFHGAERLVQIVTRFSRGRRRFRDMIACLERDFLNKEIDITFCVSSSVLKRNWDLIERLQNLGHKVAAHGYYHTRMTNYSKDQQAEILKKSYQCFSDLGFSVSGFRCPFLNYNQDTIEAFESSQYQWTSQQLIFWENGFNGQVNRLFSLYNTTTATESLSLPNFNGKILEIPITAPDDEILYERCRIRDVDTIIKTWCDLLDQTYRHGELFHLLFHPERFPYFKDAMLRVIKKVKQLQPFVWTPSLDELTKWWQRRAQIKWSLKTSASDAWTVWIKAPKEATILLKSPNLKAESRRVLPDENDSETLLPVYKDYVPVRPLEQGETESKYPAGTLKKHIIGLAWNCPNNLEQFLREEGFLVERSGNPQDYSLFIGGKEEFTEAGKRSFLEKIDACQQPLLRIWRWPRGARAALTISADVDAIDLRDFLDRALHF